jgi:hypothetical protein
VRRFIPNEAPTLRIPKKHAQRLYYFKFHIIWQTAYVVMRFIVAEGPFTETDSITSDKIPCANHLHLHRDSSSKT